MIERQEKKKYFTTLDKTKSLTIKQINADFLKYLREQNDLKNCLTSRERLNMAARLFLIRKGYLTGGENPAGESKEIFDNLVEYIEDIQPDHSDISSDNRISAFSRKEQKEMMTGAREFKKEEEKRAGQTYKEMDLES